MGEEEIDEEKEVQEVEIEGETDSEGIKISSDVVAVISGVAVSEVEGVYGMSGGFAGRNFRSSKR